MTQLNASFAIVEADGTMTQAFRDKMNALNALIPLSGTGSPEGAVEGLQYQLYVNDSGTAGNILYVKKLAAIGGDTTQGWILV
jgi:hypothetical protein